MVLAGITCVGEFHYVHHQVDGSPYPNPNAMGEALRTAARDAGLRISLLDACYVAGGLDANGPLPIAPEQLRFSDGDASAWAARVSLLDDDATSRIGAAIHSVRAVPRDQIATVVNWSHNRPLHVHLSEQVAENQACELAYSMTPTELLAVEGALSSRTTAVHATHLTNHDIELLGQSATFSCFCPTTERDLADGIGPSTALLNAGSPLCLGSDQHAVIDPFEEARGLEMHERLATHERGRLQISQLVDALTVRGHQSLGWADAGRIAMGYRADLVSVRLNSVRTAGSDPAQALLSAYAADVDTVVIDGRVVVVTGIHRDIDVELELHDVICELWALIES
jgi:cytosine/adenosine deaminase-related metal-dependent hydrolase